VSIETDPTRRKIQLFEIHRSRKNPSENRSATIAKNLASFLWKVGFSLQINVELASLQEKLGSEHIILDLAAMFSDFEGVREKVFVARDAVELVQDSSK
jgi:hypothetical protein